MLPRDPRARAPRYALPTVVDVEAAFDVVCGGGKPVDAAVLQDLRRQLVQASAAHTAPRHVDVLPGSVPEHNVQPASSPDMKRGGAVEETARAAPHARVLLVRVLPSAHGFGEGGWRRCQHGLQPLPSEPHAARSVGAAEHRRVARGMQAHGHGWLGLS